MLPQAWGRWAMAAYPQWTEAKVRLEGERFRDHWRAQSGAKGVKADWLATWRNWCRSDLAHRDDPKPNGVHPHASLDEFTAGVARRLTGATEPTQKVIDG